jgi:hypothetical protein
MYLSKSQSLLSQTCSKKLKQSMSKTFLDCGTAALVQDHQEMNLCLMTLDLTLGLWCELGVWAPDVVQRWRFDGNMLLMCCKSGPKALRCQFKELGDDDAQKLAKTCFDCCKADLNNDSLIIQHNKTANSKRSESLPNIGIRKARSRISCTMCGLVLGPTGSCHLTFWLPT